MNELLLLAADPLDNLLGFGVDILSQSCAMKRDFLSKLL